MTASREPAPPLALWALLRRSPFTLGYVCVLLLTHAWILYGLPPARAAAVLRYVSTNTDNLADHPVRALLGSALFFDGTLTDLTSRSFAATFITLGIGVCCFLAWAERRWGSLRAFAVFLAGHVGATLLTAAVIVLAVRQGWYPASVRHSLDYGISYGAQTVMAAGTSLLPRRARPPWALLVLCWPLGGLEMTGPLPDFTTLGHLLAAAIGFALLPLTLRWGRPRTRPV
ncbi:rhomboid-like protein [Streptacidiphilus rugosus]|uniref:rhomboid-like protein n=1 Tax=Streptacidiphilus rugosus TaxID=405783 RepID=UPI00068C4306|nr:rhomboid-like protein [Streptacidiphilus rugosus]